VLFGSITGFLRRWLGPRTEFHPIKLTSRDGTFGTNLAFSLHPMIKCPFAANDLNLHAISLLRIRPPTS